MVPSPLMASTNAWVTHLPMNSLSGARKVRTSIESSGAISVSMSMTGIPASIILLTGAVSVPMPNAWMATKSHFCEAILSIAARCVTLLNTPSNQVTSTLNNLPQYSAACLPWAHQVACSPAFEKAALSGFGDLPTSFAIAAATKGLTQVLRTQPRRPLRTLRQFCEATFDPPGHRFLPYALRRYRHCSNSHRIA